MQDVRARYIAAFKKGLAELQATRPQVHPEVRIEINMQTTHELYRLIVVDALERASDGSVKAVKFITDPQLASYPELNLESPLVWHDITFTCLPFGFPEARLLEWGNRWIHDESPVLGAQDGLTGIIHSVTQPSMASGAVEFSVDFGSAPLEAFEELLVALHGYVQAAGSYVSSSEA
jgi:hypothetical protein